MLKLSFTGGQCLKRAGTIVMATRASSPFTTHWNARSSPRDLVSTRSLTTCSSFLYSSTSQPTATSCSTSATTTTVSPSFLKADNLPGNLTYEQLCTPESIVSSHFDLSHIPASEQPHILRDFFLVPNYLSEEEQDMLVAAATKKLKRALGKQVRYEDGHFDGVITRYRECSATDWGTTPSTSGTTVQQIDQEKNKNTNMGTGANGNTGRNRTSPNEIMQAVKQEFFPSHWKWVAPHILELEAGKGGIKPHVDHLDASGEVVAGLCLGSDAVMELIHEEDPHKHFRVLLPRGCFYFQRDSVRYHYRHGIPIQQKDHQFRGIIVPKDRRISIMLRNALEPQAGRTGVPSNHKM